MMYNDKKKVSSNEAFETLTIHLYMSEAYSSDVKNSKLHGISTTIIVYSIKELADTIKDLKDAKNSAVITRLISEIFKQKEKELLLARKKAKITITVVNSQNIHIIQYSKILLNGCKIEEIS